MRNVLVLSQQGSQFCKSLNMVLESFENVLYKSEHDFPKVSELIEYIQKNKITEVLMPNPYGNNKRNACYRKLKEENIKVVASDRGALPNTWFFDQGFNYDSKSYQPKVWDHELSHDKKLAVEEYLQQLLKGDNALEKQGDRDSGENLRLKLGLKRNKKVIFIPMQRPSDTVIKFFAGFAQSVPNFVEQIQEIEKKLNNYRNDYVFLVKKHPLETQYFNFNSENIGYVTDETNFYDLIELADTVLLINSGVGVNALAFGKPTLALGNAFYAHDGLAHHVTNLDDAVSFIKKPVKPDYIKVQRFFSHLITNVYSFGIFKTELVSQSDGGFRNVTRSIEFDTINWNGEKLNLNKKSILVVSPLVPHPIYRGNQARIDAFIRWLISNEFKVDLVVLNGSFESMKSSVIREQMLATYKGISDVTVYKDPELEKKLQIKNLKKLASKNTFTNLKKLVKTRDAQPFVNYLKSQISTDRKVYESILIHELNSLKDKYQGNQHDLVNEAKMPYKFAKAVKNQVQQKAYDYILLNYAKSIACIPDNFSGKVVLDTHDYQSMFLEEDQVFNKKNLDIDLHRFRQNEHELMSKADVLIAINANEEKVFREILPNKQAITVPAFFAEPPIAPKFWGYNFDALYVGSISNFNVGGLKWFLDEVLPKILLLKPNFRLAIAGNVGKSKEIEWSKYKDNLSVLGRVDDLNHLYNTSCLVIAPILGGAGMKIKVVEALSHGKAIVGTTKAFDGIHYEATQAALVKDEPDEFAKNVLKVITNQSFKQEIERKAKALYELEHSVKALNLALDNLFNS